MLNRDVIFLTDYLPDPSSEPEREQRLAIAELLYRPFPRRLEFLKLLRRAMGALGADRAGVVYTYVDEPRGSVVPYCVHDALRRVPKRTWDPRQVAAAWNIHESLEIEPDHRIRSFGVYLGSRELRHWWALFDSSIVPLRLDDSGLAMLGFVSGMGGAMLGYISAMGWNILTDDPRDTGFEVWGREAEAFLEAYLGAAEAREIGAAAALARKIQWTLGGPESGGAWWDDHARLLRDFGGQNA